MAFKIFILLICGIVVFNLIFNSYQVWLLHAEKRPFGEGWYTYQSADLYADDKIYPALISSLKKNDKVFISLFLWPYVSDSISSSTRDLVPNDIHLAKYMQQQGISGDVFIDSINFDYKNVENFLSTNEIIASTPLLHWYILYQPYALPNHLIMWLFHNPWFQQLVNNSKLDKMMQILRKLMQKLMILMIWI